MSSVSPAAIPQSQARPDTVVKPKSKFRKYLPMYLSIAPYFIIFLAFSIIPTVFSLYLAFQKWDGIGQMSFIGFNNFSYAFSDPKFGTAILNTFEIWFMSTIPMLFLALIMALAQPADTLQVRLSDRLLYTKYHIDCGHYIDLQLAIWRAVRPHQHCPDRYAPASRAVAQRFLGHEVGDRLARHLALGRL